MIGASLKKTREATRGGGGGGFVGVVGVGGSERQKGERKVG
jgi:hypothetical protein